MSTTGSEFLNSMVNPLLSILHASSLNVAARSMFLTGEGTARVRATVHIGRLAEETRDG
jgi:hypothetical protein